MPTSVPATEPPIVRKARKKSGWDSRVVIGLVVGALVLIGGALSYQFFLQKPQSDPLQGELTATRESGKLEPVTMHREWIKLDEELVDLVLKQMVKGVTLRSENIVLRLQGTAEGIRISVTPGQHADLIAVETQSHKGLAKWYAREVAKMADKQQKEVIRAATKFIQEWADAAARGDKKPDYSRFHDDLGIAALAKGVGSEVIAVVGENIHRCVAEQNGTLFFLLPSGTQRFDLQGREHGHGKLVFPGHFKVRVADEPAKKSSPKSSPEKKSEADDDEKSEMRTNAFGKPALNDPSAVDESMPAKPQPKKKAEPKKDDDT